MIFKCSRHSISNSFAAGHNLCKNMYFNRGTYHTIKSEKKSKSRNMSNVDMQYIL